MKNSENQFKKNQWKDIVGVAVYLEGRKKRVYVGRLIRDFSITGSGTYLFRYDEKYIRLKNSLPLGPEFPLTKTNYMSEILFPFFSDRLPSTENPAYPEYLAKFDLNKEEKDPLILLSTIGSAGPSSFVFEPMFAQTSIQESIRNFRSELGLTIRDFSAVFDVSTASILRIEKSKTSARDILKRIEIYKRFPEVALFEVNRNSSKINSHVKEKLINKLLEMGRTNP